MKKYVLIIYLILASAIFAQYSNDYYGNALKHIAHSEFQEVLKDATKGLNAPHDPTIKVSEDVVRELLYGIRGYANLELRNYRDAIEDLTIAIQINPFSQYVGVNYYRRGLSKIRLGVSGGCKDLYKAQSNGYDCLKEIKMYCK